MRKISYIYLTGDTHARFNRFTTDNFPEQKKLTKDDYVIICGDFGGVWNYLGETNEEKYWLDWLNKKPFTTLFVDGNHECVHKNTEVLTDKGWIRIEDLYYSDDECLVASVNLDTHLLSFSKPLNKIRKYAPKLIDFNGTNYRQCVTPNHDIIVGGKKIKAEVGAKSDLREEDFRFNVVNCSEANLEYSNEIIEILTAIIMDGTVVEEKKYHPNSKKIRIQFHLKKIRKINYLQNLFDSNKIKYTITTAKDGSIYIRIYGEYARYLYGLLHNKKEIPNEWRFLSNQQFRYLLNGLVNTDGSFCSDVNTIKWRTTSKHDMDIVSELCVLHNYDISTRVSDENPSGYTDDSKTQYVSSIGRNKKLKRRLKIEEIDYNDYVYCLTMEDGTLITRYNYIPSITGNCFTRLNKYPRMKYHGGMVHRIRDSVLHLMRGYVFDFDGKKFFTFGGAKSHDIQDGILDPKDYPTLSELVKVYNIRTRFGEMLRIKGISWWKEELPTKAEMGRGIRNLEKVNWKVDYVISHCAPLSISSKMYPDDSDKLTVYFDELIKRGLLFRAWYFGHFHGNRVFDYKYHMLYEKIERLI